MRDDNVVEATARPAVPGMFDPFGSVVAGRYRIETSLGQGAMADVYRAVDDHLNRPVAIKLFRSGTDTAVRTRFAAEAQALGRLSHSALVGIYDAGVDGDRPYLVMQLVDGETLRDRLLNGPLTTDEVVALGARLSLGLAHVHHNGVVHRDIKPSNIVLDGTGAPHLADFGIALLLDAARMTGSNEIMGTPAYLSPEQILGSDVGAAADIYSLGLVLLECLTGQLEYPGGSKVESALARLHRPPRIPAGVTPVLARLLTAMTSLDAEDRPAAKDCAAWFVAVREHSGMSGRAARLAAAHWLARRGRRIGTSRTKAPLFSGWRRLAIAGSGLAMAIFASAWLFMSLLPRVMPVPPYPGVAAQPQSPSIGDSPGVAPRPNQTAMHVAAAMTTTSAGRWSVATPTTMPRRATSPLTGTSSVTPIGAPVPIGSTVSDPLRLQSDPVQGGPVATVSPVGRSEPAPSAVSTTSSTTSSAASSTVSSSTSSSTSSSSTSSSRPSSSTGSAARDTSTAWTPVGVYAASGGTHQQTGRHRPDN
jgi:eukaryotic-like serine/threonine-protein kinase